MPSYEYFCEVHGEFEEWHSIVIKLEHCPKCKEEGREQKIERLISLSGKGIVELAGQDLVDKVKADAQQMKRDMVKDEKMYANMLGDGRYQSLQQKMDKRKRG